MLNIASCTVHQGLSVLMMVNIAVAPAFVMPHVFGNVSTAFASLSCTDSGSDCVSALSGHLTVSKQVLQLFILRRLACLGLLTEVLNMLSLWNLCGCRTHVIYALVMHASDLLHKQLI